MLETDVGSVARRSLKVPSMEVKRGEDRAAAMSGV